MNTLLTLRLAALVVALGLTATSQAGRAAGAVDQKTYDRLQQVYELVDEGEYERALERLQTLRSPGAKAYEKAVILQTYGYAYAGKDDYASAIDAFSRCLALDALPKTATRSLLYALVQLQVATARYAEAVVRLEQWLALEDRPTPEASALAGWVYAEVGSYDRAVTHLRKAIGQADNPKESWHQQLLGVYFETKRYGEAALLMEDMVRRFPRRKQYWLQLSGTYQALEDDRKALAVMELAYRRGLLSEQRELLNLGRYYLYLGVPYKAAQLLAKELESGAISPALENWRLLSDAWLSARELQLALRALERGLASTPDGDLQLRRAHIATELADWALVFEAVEAALASADLANPGAAYLLGGIALHHLQRPEQALAMFRQAQGFDDSRAQAERWSAHLAYEVDEPQGLGRPLK